MPILDRARTILALADAALDLPPAERAAFLARQCVSDAELLAHVQRYLAACDRAAHGAGFLTGTAGPYAEPILEDLTTRASRAEASIPGRLTVALDGRYHLDREIGRGGMAIIYLAHAVRDGSEVAVKVLHPSLSREVGATRFLREIAITAELRHPNLVPLVESGEADGLLYYIMPYTHGESLAALLARERQLSLPGALAIARDVASALDHAHARGIVHRDVKPSNIMIDGEGAKVLDFGVARAIAAASGDRITATGLVVGTSQYMSPEQSLGDRGLDGRSDVYALACVVYEMLVGTPPFTGATPQIVLAKHLRAPVPDLSLHCPDVDGRVSQAIARALAKVPAHRFPSAGEFVRALSVSA